jgi:prophage antirepressor-like protein
MNEVKTYENAEFGALSVTEIAGKTYFPASSCTKILGYKHAGNAVIKY